MPILIVEDDQAIRDVLVGLLEDSGYTVLVANNGEQALEQLYTSDPLPWLIILDLMMPRMNGPAFRAAQLGDPQLAHIPVIVLSAVSQLDTHAANLGAAAVIGKPFDVDELLAMVAWVREGPLLEQAQGA